MPEMETEGSFVRNVVATMDVGEPLDLIHLCGNLPNASYDPTRFSALILRRYLNSSATGLVFSSGKLVCTGTKSEEECMRVCDQFAKLVSPLTYLPGMELNVSIRNVVASYDVGFPISLHRLYDSDRSSTIYEPELFPGLTYRMTSPKATLLVFHTGKIVITGAKSTCEARLALTNVTALLERLATHVEPMLK